MHTKTGEFTMHKMVLITGCTSGIGKELCYSFAKDNYSLVLVARNQIKLFSMTEEFKKNYAIPVFPILCDLREKNAALFIFEQVKKLNLEIDILVNAAGFGLYGETVHTDIFLQQELMQVNITSLVCLCQAFGLIMKERKKGYIINFSSISGFFPGTFMSSYYASKSFVLSFSLALARELKPFGVKVLALCPGVVDTPFYRKAKADKTYSKLLFRMPPLSTQEFVKKAYKIIKKENCFYKIVGLKNKMIIFLSFFIPKRFLTILIGWIQAKR